MTPKRRIIPVFVPHLGCPNDCVFCNQRKISGKLFPATPETVHEAVASARAAGVTGAALAFYGGSFTAIDRAEQEALLSAAAEHFATGEVAALRVSTRPDRITPEALALLKKYRVETVELGAQSMDDGVLRRSGRGHTADSTRRAAKMVKESGFSLILQMMTGLPGDSGEESIYTARELAALAPEGVRIYPAVILRDTPLYELWQRGKYREHTVEDAVSLCARIVPIFEAAGVKIIRLGLNPSEELSGGEAAGGAYHPALGEMVYSRIWREKAEALLSSLVGAESVTLGVKSSRVSVMTGQKRCNAEYLRGKFGLKELKIRPAEVPDGEIVVLERH
jgi:histone acetyltransferase (RNA polymerase elongator complex component)